MAGLKRKHYAISTDIVGGLLSATTPSVPTGGAVSALLKTALAWVFIPSNTRWYFHYGACSLITKSQTIKSHDPVTVFIHNAP